MEHSQTGGGAFASQLEIGGNASNPQKQTLTYLEFSNNGVPFEGQQEAAQQAIRDSSPVQIIKKPRNSSMFTKSTAVGKKSLSLAGAGCINTNNNFSNYPMGISTTTHSNGFRFTNRNQQQVTLDMSNSPYAQPLVSQDGGGFSYTEARRVRQSIEKDVELLRNRVRMLQLEEIKAAKKISETQKKTQQIMALKTQNDEHFQKQIEEQRKTMGTVQFQQQINYQRRLKQVQELNSKKQKLAEQKYREAEEVRRHILEQRAAKERQDRDFEDQLQQRRNQRLQHKDDGQQKIAEFLQTKHQLARQDRLKQLAEEQNQIHAYESEAKYLEQMEAQLLKKLQDTQLVERTAFNQLENAMIESSLPKKIRVLTSAGDSIINTSSITQRSKNASLKNQ